MENEPNLPLGPRLFWIGFFVATIAFWSFVGVEVDRFVESSGHAPAMIASTR
jgi:hypothetical protein